ncbi:MAG: hypothetical protein EOO50_08500 [Flavobacterium sp.]|uniref:hypothetical protein n=1 Tax=Flavobacterium sp. TaxID=239 RepID=UPI00121A3906|nr:hypothetical protein [Flavobacterium sp.]RZJ66723.1 MAG: hypothetical protein EOO50_08500 [Flavobacterium sp.]
MITHTLIFKCKLDQLPDPQNVGDFLIDELDHPRLFYFGRDGKRVTGNTKKFITRLKDTFYVKVSFHHLLKLDPIHSFAVIKEALRKGFITKFTYDENQLNVILY